MVKTIAVAGKGGTGKTTLCGLMINQLVKRDKKPILAVDADPAYNLNSVLGFKIYGTVGEIVENMKENQDNLPAGMSKPEYIDYMLQENITETENVDLLVMGRPEGAGCYCAANNFLKVSIDRLQNNYPFVVIDNEAGLEHLSRKTKAVIDVMLIISDASLRGLKTANRIQELVKDLGTDVREIYLIVNRVFSELKDESKKYIEDHNLKLLTTIPLDDQLREFDEIGKPLVELPEDSDVISKINHILDNIKI